MESTQRIAATSDTALRVSFSDGKLREGVGRGLTVPPVEVPGAVGPDLGLFRSGEQLQIVEALGKRDDPGDICGAMPWAAVVKRSPTEVVACCSTALSSGLFYAFVPGSNGLGTWHFATDPISLLDLRGTGRGLDYEWLGRFLSGSADSTRSPYAGVRRLGWGRSLIASSDGESRVVPWLTDGWPDEPDLVGEVARRQFLSVFDSAVSELVARSGPVTFQVSGGLDSTFVAASIARALPPGEQALGLVSTPIPGAQLVDSRPIMDESPYAKLMGQRYPQLRIETVINHERVSPLVVAKQLTRITGWPAIASGNLVWGDAISKIAQQRGSRVQSSGQRGNLTFSWAHEYAASRTWPSLAIREVGRFRRWLRSSKRSNPYLLEAKLTARGPSPQWSYEGFRLWLGGEVQTQGTGLASPTDDTVFELDPFRSRKVLDVAARIAPATWRKNNVYRGFARWAGEDRIPDQIRLRMTSGAQSPDMWAWVFDKQKKLHEALSELRRTAPLAAFVDWPTLEGSIGSWDWGNPNQPPPAMALNRAFRLGNIGIFQSLQHTGS